MRKSLAALAIGSLMLASPIAVLSQSGKKQFDSVTSTAGGYYTWDLDMINIEKVSQTGQGVYVAVLDTGLVPNWRDYFPEARIATELGAGFDQSVSFKHANAPCGYEVERGKVRRTGFVGSRGSTHGTHVTSTIIGYFYQSPTDAAAGFALPPIMVRGVAPDVTIVPVKVLADYQVPAMPQCGIPAQNAVFGTDAMIAAGIDYVTSLAKAGFRPMVINMSLGGSSLSPVEQTAIDNAIANGVIIVAAAGNEGEEGMSYPGAYPPVISAGSVGWTGEFVRPGTATSFYRMWWLQYPYAPILPGSGEVADPTHVNDIYVSDFSSRELTPLGQELDVLAPGSWVRGPFPGSPGYQHLPWWSKGQGDFHSAPPLANFYYVGGTSMATPHTASVAALMLQKNVNLVQTQVQSILKSTALPMPAADSRWVYDPFTNPAARINISWDTFCEPVQMVCDAVGSGVIQADGAIAATP